MFMCSVLFGGIKIEGGGSIFIYFFRFVGSRRGEGSILVYFFRFGGSGRGKGSKLNYLYRFDEFKRGLRSILIYLYRFGGSGRNEGSIKVYLSFWRIREKCKINTNTFILIRRIRKSGGSILIFILIYFSGIREECRAAGSIIIYLSRFGGSIIIYLSRFGGSGRGGGSFKTNYLSRFSGSSRSGGSVIVFLSRFAG